MTAAAPVRPPFTRSQTSAPRGLVRAVSRKPYVPCRGVCPVQRGMSRAEGCRLALTSWGPKKEFFFIISFCRGASMSKRGYGHFVCSSGRSSRPSSRPTSRPSSRPTSRPTSRPSSHSLGHVPWSRPLAAGVAEPALHGHGRARRRRARVGPQGLPAPQPERERESRAAPSQAPVQSRYAASLDGGEAPPTESPGGCRPASGSLGGGASSDAGACVTGRRTAPGDCRV